ncbi:MAG: O-antigen ligase family protein [Anaerolineae bacterium]
MRTKVSFICDKVLEGGWLLAVIVTPLFFNIYSSRVFEPDKLTLLRSIALMMAVVWITKQVGRMFGEGQPAKGEAGGILSWLRQPLVIPSLVVVVVYIISTLASVAPRTSFLGSYQRLQGTFSTFSYIVVALIVMHEMRRREQFNRLVTTAILTSFPIALYGIIQHLGIDAMPWGSDVTARVASNMGNAIFVSAYLIMAIPLTLARLVQSWHGIATDLSGWRKWAFGGFVALVFGAQMLAWISRGLGRGLGLGVLIVAACVLLAAYLRKPVAKFLLLGSYIVLFSVQLICLVYSQSRGPQLGFIVGVAVFLLLYLTIRRWGKAVWAWLGAAVLLASFLVVFNLPNTPFQKLRSLPYVGRLGSLLETDGGTGMVRLLIADGTVKLIKSNPLRALVGYGPETMYVAYNRFYPPALANLESRNASPDRSHNETFDTFVITGLLGFLAYIFLFGSVFYFALKWLGLVQNRRNSWFYWIAIGAGAILGFGGPFFFTADGIYAGVGGMGGFVLGLMIYVVPMSIRASHQARSEPLSESELSRFIWIAAIAAVVLSHFVEINFGIAIASSRTYFWMCLALLAVAGKGFIALPKPVSGPVRAASGTAVPLQRGNTARVGVAAKTEAARKSSSSPQARSRVSASSALDIEQPESEKPQTVLLALLLGFILSVMAWTFVTNPQRDTDIVTILIKSFTTLAARQLPDTKSLGMFGLVLSTLVLGVTIIVAEVAQFNETRKSHRWWLNTAVIALAIAFSTGFLFAVLHASRLIGNVDITNLIYSFYAWIAFIWIVLTALLYVLVLRPRSSGSAWTLVVGIVLVVIAGIVIDNANMRIIKADIVYKQGQRYDEAQDWNSAIQVYSEAVGITPKEDFYWLFYGRVLMERARAETNVSLRETYMARTQAALEEAHRLNPLNTDHTKNLAAFYRTWAEMDTDTASRSNKVEKSLQYYALASTLSPYNAQILNEWGQMYFAVGQDELALKKYEESLKLDPKYEKTYLYLGDAMLKANKFQEAVSYYKQGLAIDVEAPAAWSALAYAYSQLGEVDQAITANLEVIKRYANDYNSLKNLALLYAQQEKYDEALIYAEQALKAATGDQVIGITAYVEQLKQLIAGKGN